MKKMGKIIILLFILALLLAVYFVVKSGIFEKEEKQTENYVLDIKAEDVDKISFKIDDQDATFLKNDTAWIKSDEETFPVDSSKIQNILEQAVELKAVRKIDDAAGLNEYGLDKPQNYILLGRKDGTNIVLYLGNSNRTTGNIYLYRGDRPETVYTVEASISTLLEGKLYDFAQADDFPSISSDKIKEIEIINELGTYKFSLDSKEDSDNWKLLCNDEKSTEVQEEKIASLITKISLLSYSDYLDYNCIDMKKYGLDSPQVQIKLSYMEQDEDKEVILNIGSVDENGNYYVCMDGRTQIHLMSADTLDSFINFHAKDYIQTAEGNQETDTEKTE